MEFSFTPRRSDASVIRWFAPPRLDTVESTRRARRLWMMAWPFFAVLTTILGLAVAVEPATLGRRLVTITSVGVLIAVLHELNRRGRTTFASWMLVLGLVVVVTQRAWITGGIHAPVGVFYSLFILVAGSLLDRRAGLITAAACIAGGILLTGAEQLGWLIPPAGARPLASSFVFLLLTIGLTLVVQNLFAPPRPAPEPLSDDVVEMIVRKMQAPIMVVLGQLGRMRQTASGPVARDVDEAIGGARTLSHLTTTLLEASRREAKPSMAERRPTDVVEVARSVVDATVALEPSRNIAVVVESAATCRYKPELIRRIVEHLVGNAVDHTPLTGRISVHVSSLPGRVRVAVHDEGPGVPEEIRRRISEKAAPFELRSGNGPQSAGLGLAFCKLAVESCGGTLRIDEAKPRGSVFVVELPD